MPHVRSERVIMQSLREAEGSTKYNFDIFRKNNINNMFCKENNRSTTTQRLTVTPPLLINGLPGAGSYNVIIVDAAAETLQGGNVHVCGGVCGFIGFCKTTRAHSRRNRAKKRQKQH